MAQDVWAVQLTGLLSGKAMAAYTSLAGDESGDYEKVKVAILQRYEDNEETHRRKFRQDKKRSDESYREFVSQLQDRLQRWAKSQELTWEQMVLIEQVYNSVPQGLAVWLRERKPRSAQQLAELADDYSLGRHSGGEAASLKDAGSSPGSIRAKEVTMGPSQSRLPLKPPGELGRNQVNSRGEKQCFHYGKWGHIMHS